MRLGLETACIISTSEMSNNFKSSCTLLSKVVTTYTTLVTLQLWKVAKVVQSCIGHFPDAPAEIDVNEGGHVERA